MYGRERQKEVVCSVPFCEAIWCTRDRKKECALRKYYLYEVIKHWRNRDTLCQILGTDRAKRYVRENFYWRKGYTAPKKVIKSQKREIALNSMTDTDISELTG